MVPPIRRGLAVVVAVALAGCSDRPSSDAGPDVAVTIFPLASITQQIVGDAAEVATLLPPGASPHAFEPTSQQMRQISSAPLVISVGLGIDHWVHDAMDATGRSEADLFDAGEALGLGTGDVHHHDEDEDEHEHSEGAVDPHIWLDPVLMRQLVPALAARLKQALPEHAATIDANAAKLINDIDRIDELYRDQLEPFHGRAIVTYHAAFNRPADRYGLVVAATLQPIEASGSVPLSRLQRSMQVIDEHDLKVIFAEPQFSPDAADLLHRETGVRVLILDPLGDPNAPDRDSWQNLMKYNLDTLVKGLSLNPEP